MSSSHDSLKFQLLAPFSFSSAKQIKPSPFEDELNCSLRSLPSSGHMGSQCQVLFGNQWSLPYGSIFSAITASSLKKFGFCPIKFAVQAAEVERKDMGLCPQICREEARLKMKKQGLGEEECGQGSNQLRYHVKFLTLRTLQRMKHKIKEEEKQRKREKMQSCEDYILYISSISLIMVANNRSYCHIDAQRLVQKDAVTQR